MILKMFRMWKYIQKDGVKDGEIVACPICEADYRVLLKKEKFAYKTTFMKQKT